MGFSCHLCRKPFQEGEQLSQKGGGDGHPSQYTASTTTCGHIFHTLCLKNFFDNFGSKNAWDSKSCPVCNKALFNKDVIKVRAYPYDECFQRPGIEDLQNENKHLRQELGLLENERNDLIRNSHELQMQNDNLKRDLDLMKLKCDQYYRVNNVQAADLENHKIEIEKLKTVVIKLSEKLTVGGHQFMESEAQSVNNGTGQVGRIGMPQVQFPNDFLFSPGYELPNPNNMLNFNGPQVKASNLPRPPGLMLPSYTMSSENVSELSSPNSGHETGNHQLSQDMKRLSLGQPCAFPLNTFSQALAQQTQQQQSQLFEHNQQQSEQGTPFQDNTSKLKEGLGTVAGNRSSIMADIFPNPGENQQQNVNLRVAPRESGGAGASGFQAPKTSGISQTAKGKDASKDTDPDNYDYDDFQDGKDHDSNKWHEKRNKRRTSSKSAGSRGSASNNPRSSDRLYSKFKCRTCNEAWGSNKSIVNQPQVCRVCKTEVFPYEQTKLLSRRQLELMQMEAEASANKKK